MFKKTFILSAAVVLVLALLFGRKVVPYATTAFGKAQAWANEQVDTGFQIDAARSQLTKIEKDIEPMLWDIAREEVEINKISEDLGVQESRLATSHKHIMTLREHLSSGQTHYVSSSNNREYSNSRVRQDLANRFEDYKTLESTLDKSRQILDLRRQGLAAAKEQLEETIAQRRELEIQIENLEARKKMVDVAKTAGKLKSFDNSRLAKTREMIEQIETRLDVETKLMNITPKFIGEIPMEEDTGSEPTDIIEAVDAYFGVHETASSGSVARN